MSISSFSNGKIVYLFIFLIGCCKKKADIPTSNFKISTGKLKVLCGFWKNKKYKKKQPNKQKKPTKNLVIGKEFPFFSQ